MASKLAWVDFLKNGPSRAIRDRVLHASGIFDVGFERPTSGAK
jgi:hypothetical protein